MSTALVGKEKTKKTYKDYEQLPEGAPYQLIGGELVMTPSPVPYHQIILRKIGYELVKFIEERKLGEVLYAPMDVYLSEYETYQPDIIFISNERFSIIGEKKIEAAPDLVIEILSESTAYYDLKHKKRMYESSGVMEYWIVDPMEKTIEVYENINGEFKAFSQGEGKGAVTSKLLEGFSVEPEKIF